LTILDTPSKQARRSDRRAGHGVIDALALGRFVWPERSPRYATTLAILTVCIAVARC
jgi:hypothetical protein